ncbi:MAG: VOC family protein [Acidimicrobiaceae bacterium]|nr:VOC family protein [Acidimicrobiaceae bacterium]
MVDAATLPETATPIVKAVDIAYIRISAPDLDAMEAFVNDFGLVVAHRDDDVLISRGLEPTPFLHVVHRGPAKFMGWAFEVDSEGDLDALAAAVPGCSPVHDIGGAEGQLGGGKRVHFVEPITGFVLEAVHGQQAEPLAARRGRHSYNHAGVDDRVGVEQDVSGNRYPIKKDPGPPEVYRLGHVVTAVPPGSHQAFMRFLEDTFGMLVSDAARMIIPPGAEEHFPPPLVELIKSTGSDVMFQFMRMDRGAAETDHHSMLVLPLMDGTPEAQFSHAAFEVFSMDDVFRGHMHFRERAAEGAPYALAWGVGRHVYGSQIYDYWHDPYGHVHEHMCDGDRVDADYGPNTIDMTDPGQLGDNGGNQWGPTVEESGVHNLNGPQCDPRFAGRSDEIRESLLSRDLSELQHIVDAI